MTTSRYIIKLDPITAAYFAQYPGAYGFKVDELQMFADTETVYKSTLANILYQSKATIEQMKDSSVKIIFDSEEKFNKAQEKILSYFEHSGMQQPQYTIQLNPEFAAHFSGQQGKDSSQLETLKKIAHGEMEPQGDLAKILYQSKTAIEEIKDQKVKITFASVEKFKQLQEQLTSDNTYQQQKKLSFDLGKNAWKSKITLFQPQSKATLSSQEKQNVNPEVSGNRSYKNTA